MAIRGSANVKCDSLESALEIIVLSSHNIRFNLRNIVEVSTRGMQPCPRIARILVARIKIT